MDKTNDKLPDEQIKADAKLYDQSYYTHLSQRSHKTPADHYIAGATAWAPWKVKHDELQAQAQRMADALDSIGNGPFPITQKELEEWLLKTKSMAREVLQQWKDGKGKEVGQAEAKEGIIRVILAGAYEVSKDAASAEEYLKSEGVDVAQLKANAQYFTWKADLIRITKEKTGESAIRINDKEAVKWYNDGFTPEQTFRETWQSDGD